MAVPARPDRDPGYRAAGAVPSDRRTARAVALSAIAVGILVAVGVLGRALAPSPTETAVPSDGEALASPAGSPFPAFLRHLDAGVPAAIPLFEGGLRWLDLVSGRVLGDPYFAPRGSVFVSSGIVTCVCDDVPWQGDGTLERFRVLAWEPAGMPLADRTVDALAVTSPLKTGDAVLRAVAVGGGWADHASLGRGSGGWSVRLDDLAASLAEPPDARFDLGWVPLDPGGMIVHPPIVRVSPDGRLVRVTVRSFSRADLGTPGSGWTERAWVARRGDDGVLGIPEPLPTRTTDAPDRCDGEGFAGSVYVRVCRGGADAPGTALVEVDGAAAIGLALPAKADDVEWALDGAAGVVYRWSPLDHTVSRIDVATRTVLERVVPPGGPFGTTIPQADLPPEGGRTGAATMLTAADDLGPRRVALSSDGRRLYAIGQRLVAQPDGTQTRASTGIWVFDTTSLAVVAHWGPDQADGQLALTQDDRFVVAIGQVGLDAAGRPDGGGMPLAIYSALDGTLVERIANVLGPDGFTPILLGPNG